MPSQQQRVMLPDIPQQLHGRTAKQHRRPAGQPTPLRAKCPWREKNRGATAKISRGVTGRTG